MVISVVLQSSGWLSFGSSVRHAGASEGEPCTDPKQRSCILVLLSSSTSVGIPGRLRQDPSLRGAVAGLADAPGHWMLQTRPRAQRAIPWPEMFRLGLWRC